MDTVVLENHVKLFVESKTAEEVYLQFKTGCVVLRAVKKPGSTTLASFWIRVLQNPNNFPPNRHVYEKSYSKQVASEFVFLKVGYVTLSVFMRTGMLTVEGDTAYAWFKDAFPRILKNYDSAVGFDSGVYLKNQKVLDARREAQRVDNIFDQQLIPSEKVGVGLVGTDAALDKKVVDRLYKTVQTPGDSLMTSTHEPPEQFPVDAVGTRDGIHVYQTWLSLLNKWMSEEGHSVYIVSPSIDVERLGEIVLAMLKHRRTASLAAIVTETRGAPGAMAETRRRLLERYEPDQQLFIEYAIFNKLKFPMKTVGCNFIATLCPSGVAEVMVTSSTFDSRFDRSILETVVCMRMDGKHFMERFINPITTA